MNGPPVIVDCCNIEVTEVFLQSKYNFLVYSLRRSRSECEFNCFGDESCFLKIEKQNSLKCTPLQLSGKLARIINH